MSDENFRKTTLFRTPPAEDTLPLKLHIFNFAIVAGGTYTVRRHRHTESEIMLPLEGFYRTRLNGTLLRVPPGNFLLVQSGDLHEDFCRGKFRFAAFRFRFEDADSFPRELPICRPELDAAFRIFPLRKESLPMELFRQIVLRAPEEHIFRRVALGNLAETFFWELLATLPEEIPPSRRTASRICTFTRSRICDSFCCFSNREDKAETGIFQASSRIFPAIRNGKTVIPFFVSSRPLETEPFR